MLTLIESLRTLEIAQLMSVYADSIRSCGAESYPQLPENLQILRAEQDFYNFLKSFFSLKCAVYAVWTLDGIYTSALRLEPLDHADILLTGLETAPDLRQKGYATCLLEAVISHFKNQGCKRRLYSHIQVHNFASIAVHEGCGFKRMLDYGRLIDGSVRRDMHTYCYEI